MMMSSVLFSVSKYEKKCRAHQHVRHVIQVIWELEGTEGEQISYYLLFYYSFGIGILLMLVNQECAKIY